MSSPYVGEIRMFGGNFAPAGWAFCSGQTVSIAQNEVLFQLIGTTYGGDGQETFNLPDLQGRVPIHQGPGFVIGQKAGVESVTLTTQQIPAHSHQPRGQSTVAGQAPTGSVWATASSANLYLAPGAPAAVLSAASVLGAGGSQPHENMMPFLTISFIISLFGIFPTQN